MKKRPRVNYKKLYKKEVKETESMVNYIDLLEQEVDILSKDNEELKAGINKVLDRNTELEKDIEDLKVQLEKANGMYIELCVERNELSYKNEELTRINHLLQDTISSFKTPGYKKLWASIKYQVKAWIKKA